MWHYLIQHANHQPGSHYTFLRHFSEVLGWTYRLLSARALGLASHRSFFQKGLEVIPWLHEQEGALGVNDWGQMATLGHKADAGADDDRVCP